MNDQWLDFFGWLAVVNIVMLTITTVGLVVMRKFAIRVQGKLFDLTESDLNVLYFKYLANFKLLVLVFNIGPYIALRLMA